MSPIEPVYPVVVTLDAVGWWRARRSEEPNRVVHAHSYRRVRRRLEDQIRSHYGLSLDDEVRLEVELHLPAGIARVLDSPGVGRVVLDSDAPDTAPVLGALKMIAESRAPVCTEDVAELLDVSVQQVRQFFAGSGRTRAGGTSTAPE